jgi:hypothetical protein
MSDDPLGEPWGPHGPKTDPYSVLPHPGSSNTPMPTFHQPAVPGYSAPVNYGGGYAGPGIVGGMYFLLWKAEGLRKFWRRRLGAIWRVARED